MDEEEPLIMPTPDRPDLTPWARIIYCIIVRRPPMDPGHLVRILARTPMMDQDDAEHATQVIMQEGHAVIHANTYKPCMRVARILTARDIPLEVAPVGYEHDHLLSVLRPVRNDREALGWGRTATPTRHLITTGGMPDPNPARSIAPELHVLNLVVLPWQQHMTPAGVLVALMRYGMSYTQALQCSGMVMLVGACTIKRYIGPPLPPDHAEAFRQKHGYIVRVTTIHLAA